MNFGNNRTLIFCIQLMDLSITFSQKVLLILRRNHFYFFLFIGSKLETRDNSAPCIKITTTTTDLAPVSVCAKILLLLRQQILFHENVIFGRCNFSLNTLGRLLFLSRKKFAALYSGWLKRVNRSYEMSHIVDPLFFVAHHL